MCNLINVFMIFCFLTAGNLSAEVINVLPPPASIQAAIDDAENGDTLILSKGTYEEEIKIISKSLNIIGAGRNGTVIRAPDPSVHLKHSFKFGANYYCVVLVDNLDVPSHQKVNLSDLTIDGGTQQDTTIYPVYGETNEFYGVGYHNASGTLSNIHVTNTRQSIVSDQFSGGGIINASNIGAVTFEVTGCLIDYYQLVGIKCLGISLTANIHKNVLKRGYLIGSSMPTPIGIELSEMTTGTISENKISGNLSSETNVEAIGICVRGGGSSITIARNTLTNNDIGVFSYHTDNNLTLSSNTINFKTTLSPNLMKGIWIKDTNGRTNLINNVMNNIPSVNMELSSNTDQRFKLDGNKFSGSEVGLMINGNNKMGPKVSLNGDSFKKARNFYIQKNNSPHDVWPTTANTYFDGMFAGTFSFSQYNKILSKIDDKHNDSNKGLVLHYISTEIPVITKVNPSYGSNAGGSLVTITGLNFVSHNTQVYFGDEAAVKVKLISDTEILAQAPPGNGIVDISVVTPPGQSAAAVSGKFFYTGPSISAPILRAIYPNEGPGTGGTKVTIEGENFKKNETFVYFGDAPVLDTEIISDTLMIVTTPPGKNKVEVIVVTPMGMSPISLNADFEYFKGPKPPHPPSNFIGVVRKNKFLTGTEYVLELSWFPSTSKNVDFYLLYLDGHLIEKIPAKKASIYRTTLKSKKAIRGFKIIAERANTLKSTPVSVRIINE